MALFGEGIDGARAAELGLAWQALDDNEVEGAAAAMAARAAKDPELARRTARSMRAEWGPPRCRGPRRWSWSARRRCGRCGARPWRTTAERELSESPPLSRPELALRALPLLALGALAVALYATGSAPSTDELRDWGEDLGWSAVVLWPVLFAVVNFVVPWPLLAGASGLVFGTAGGTVLALLGVLLASVTQMLCARTWPESASASGFTHGRRGSTTPSPRTGCSPCSTAGLCRGSRGAW